MLNGRCTQLESEKLQTYTLKQQLEIERGYSARLTNRQSLSISSAAAGSVPVGATGGVGVVGPGGGAGGVVGGVGGLGQVGKSCLEKLIIITFCS